MWLKNCFGALSNSVSISSTGWPVQSMKLYFLIRREAGEKDTRNSRQAQIPTRTGGQI